MDKQHPTAAMVNVFQKETKTKLVTWLVGWLVVFGLLWLGDWTMRMVHFGWHREVFSPRAAGAGRGAPADVAVDSNTGNSEANDLTASAVEIWGGNRKGGLTGFVPSAGLRRPYEEWHDAHAVRLDGNGYAMEPGSASGKNWVVAIGDSFLLTGNQHLFSWELEELAGVKVLNRGRFAAGPFLELKKYIQDVPRDQWSPVLVWEIAGRELGAALFGRQAFLDWFRNKPKQASAATDHVHSPTRMRWNALIPTVLDLRLPNTSAMAYFSRKLWGWCRLEVFGEWPSDVLPVPDGRFGPTLFYGENLKILPRLTAGEQGEGVLSVIHGIANELRERGVELVVLLVPEKEQVWTEDLPENLREGIEASADLLRWLEREGRKRGIRVVNPLETFRRMTRDGIALYWRDDTHWNGEGMRKAAELTAAELKTIPGWEEHTE